MLLIAAKILELSITDLDNMSIGSLVEFLEAELEMNRQANGEGSRKATQDDFDSF